MRNRKVEIDNHDIDSIDLTVLDFLPDALAEIEDVLATAPSPVTKRSLSSRQGPSPNNIIDAHGM